MQPHVSMEIVVMSLLVPKSHSYVPRLRRMLPLHLCRLTWSSYCVVEMVAGLNESFRYDEDFCFPGDYLYGNVAENYAYKNCSLQDRGYC